MKLPESLRISAKSLLRDRKGVALVTVLTIMALTTILVLTFFSLATSEGIASDTYSKGTHAHQVAEQAVNLVIAQIREATNTEEDNAPLTQRLAWASQPGAIRRWGSNGNLDQIFKLYSDDVMRSDKADEFQKDFANLKGWSNKPQHFVDLNEPVIRGEKVYYPIVHPVAALVPRWPGSGFGGDKNGVEGFSHSSADVEEGELGKKAAGVAFRGVDNDSKQSTTHVAMPVQWLYQLEDGTVGYLSESGSDNTGYPFVAISGNGSPDRENQIVARFAFWADDETAKLNLNTHAGGLAWDIPKAGGEMDMNMGRYQPAQKEWQRYPGHPATTHLGAALAPGVLDIVNDRDAMEMLYKVVPRVVGGGSESGTRLINTRDPKEQNGLVADTEPLFPSVDDMIMRSDREEHEFPDAKGNPIPDDELSEYLERSKFFLSVYSRAPEVNMFNLPRVAMWPIYDAQRSSDKRSDYQTKLSPFDRLIHYCSSVGGGSGDDRYDYIFRRKSADSPTIDYQDILRNQELYSYLDTLMSTDIPGYRGAFSDPERMGKAGQEQLLTLIFDYIRSTNLHDDTLYEDFTDAFSVQNNSNHRTYTNGRDARKNNKGFGLKGHGQVTPIKIQGKSGTMTKGMGRFFTVSNAEIMVVTAAEPRFAGQKFPGVRDYRGTTLMGADGGPAWVNLPPLKTIPSKDDAAKLTWPKWLQRLKEDSENPLLDQTTRELRRLEWEAAFEPINWNWNLAWLHEDYREKVLQDPTTNKYNRNLLPATVSNELRLKDDERMVQAIFMFSLFSPSIGWSSINPDMQIDITRTSGMTFAADKFGDDGGAETIEFLGFTDKYGDRPDEIQPATFRWSTSWIKPHREGGARAYGGLLPFSWVASGRDLLGDSIYQQGGRYPGSVWWQLHDMGVTTSRQVQSRLSPIDRGYPEIVEAVERVKAKREIDGQPKDIAQAYRYDLVTIPFLVKNGVNFEGGKVRFEISDGGKNSENSQQDDLGVTDLVQTIHMNFPPFTFASGGLQMAQGEEGWVNEFNAITQNTTSALELASATADPGNALTSPAYHAYARDGSWDNRPTGWGAVGRLAEAVRHWNGRYIKGPDIVQSVAVGHGDLRLMAADPEVEEDDEHFKPHRDYGNQKMAHCLTNSQGQPFPGFNPAAESDYLIVTGLGPGTPYGGATPLGFAVELSKDVQRYGDFDNGAGTMIDGPYINKPDEGNVHALKTRFEQEIVHYWEAQRNYGEFPYFSHPEKAESGGPAYFSPNRIVSGPGMFGSLPTGLQYGTPWKTLLFRPDVKGTGGTGYSSTGHPGAEDPPDHLVMDLFWMPVVEPYAISEPLSTAGKVNINYEIMPFLHIERSTALRGVFRSEYMLMIPNKYHNSYKHGRGRGRGWHWRDNPFGGELQGKILRAVILESETLAEFDKRFDDGKEIFKSATEITEMHLIPQEVAARLNQTRGSIGLKTPTVGEMADGQFWRSVSLVGDNSRERPYTNIHQRITTKSNTFKVHYRAQVIKQSRRDADTEYSKWIPEVDSVQAEYRGSSIVERYVDPNDEEIPDFANSPRRSLNQYYRFRVINPRRFAP